MGVRVETRITNQRISMECTVPVFLLTILAVPASAQTLTSIKLVEGLGIVTDIRTAPGDDESLFIVRAQRGIQIFRDGMLVNPMFLEFPLGYLQHPEGMKSLAFHPEYQVNGKFYVMYMDSNLGEHFVQYTVSATNPDLADPDSGVHILPTFTQPSPLHNWNDLVFGPDGMLYLTTGNAIWNNDLSVSYAQDLGSLHGKILRLDVDLPPPYIPPDNPFVGVPGAREEVWVYGLKQPWKMSFDRDTGDGYVGDVGGIEIEEVNFIPAGHPGGLNFGWRCMQGSLCMLYNGCNPMCGDPSWVAPIYEYPHLSSQSCVIGGFVYRGDDLPGMQGTYVFGDNTEGRFWSFRYDGVQITDFEELTDELRPSTFSQTTCFGEDNEGELYFANVQGEIWKIIPGTCGAENYCQALSNSTGDVARITSAGSTSVAANDFELQCSGSVPQSFGVFFYGPLQVETPFGDGFKCVGGHTFRLAPPIATDASGFASRLVDFKNPAEPAAEIGPGSTWNFQFYYRDPLSPGVGYNTSDGLSALFCP